ncbi:MAG TPA: IS66 family transposase [Gemmataceae bacterium]|nr:IS66 family transposase [Gemmataceae bacterium]
MAALEAQLQDQARLLVDLARKLQDKDLPTAPPRPEAPAAPATAKKPSGRKPGGQPGHPPHLKQWLAPQRVTQIVPLVLTRCERCRTPLPVECGPEDAEPTRFQVAELPDLKTKVTEYQRHSRTCPCCGELNQAVLPPDFPTRSIAPGLAALMAYLVGACGLSKRRVEEVVEAVFEVPVALGTVARLEQEMGAALEPAHQEASAAVQQAPVKHLDETGWKKAGRKRWLWVAATANVVVFLIHRLRNAAVVLLLVGRTLRGILCSDRWRAYDGFPLLQRQICGSHLKRNWEKLRERGGPAQRIADACLVIKDQVFEQWHLFRGGGLTRSQLDDRLAPLALELLAVLQKGGRSRDKKTARFCERVLTVYPALWTFVVEEGVEPTNNHAERVQRLAVLYRKNCFGCHSDSGCRFVERLLTVVQTLRLQKRPVLQFLKETLIAHRAGQAMPRLVLAG